MVVGVLTAAGGNHWVNDRVLHDREWIVTLGCCRDTGS